MLSKDLFLKKDRCCFSYSLFHHEPTIQQRHHNASNAIDYNLNKMLLG